METLFREFDWKYSVSFYLVDEQNFFRLQMKEKIVDS